MIITEKKRINLVNLVCQVVDHFIFNKLTNEINNLQDGEKEEENVNIEDDQVYLYASNYLMHGTFCKVTKLTTA